MATATIMGKFSIYSKQTAFFAPAVEQVSENQHDQQHTYYDIL